MGFNKRYLPDIGRLEEIYLSSKNEENFLKEVAGNSDCLIGSIESMDFLEKIRTKELSQNEIRRRIRSRGI